MSRSRYLGLVGGVVLALGAAAWAGTLEAPLACPPGWSVFDSPQLGMRACVPPGFVVRFRGDVMLSVERAPGVAAAGAWVMALQPKKGASALQIAEEMNRFFTQNSLWYRGQVVGQPRHDRAMVQSASTFNGQSCEGRFIATLAAGGSMAYVMGVLASQGRLSAELQTLEHIASSFAVYTPRVPWATVRSPGGGISLRLPKDWQMETTEGKTPKNEVDWVAYDPKTPGARAFSFTPKFCTADLAQNLLYQAKGYRVGVFAGPQECLQAALEPYFPGVRVTSMQPNAGLTQALAQQNAQVNQFLQQLQAGSVWAGVYDCQAAMPIGGSQVMLAFRVRMDQMVMSKAVGAAAVQTDVWLKGWMAPADQFLAMSPVLERVTESMDYTPEYLAMVRKAEAQRAKNQADTDRYCRKIEREIWRNRFDTDAYISQIWSDFWANQTATVNPETGEIERVDNDKLVDTENGGKALKEDVDKARERGDKEVKVIREATDGDYMRGVRQNLDFDR